MYGTYRSYIVDVNYSGLVTVFVPDGENPEEIINTKLDEIMEEFPDEIGELYCYSVECEEN